MQKSAMLNHVDIFLLSVDPRGSTVRSLKFLLELGVESEYFREALRPLYDWVGDQIDKSIGPREKLDTSLLMENQKFLTLMALLNLKATSYLQSPQAASISHFEKMRDAGKIIKDFLANIEPDFVERLYFESLVRAGKDGKFAKLLEDSKDDVRFVLSHLIDHAYALNQSLENKAPVKGAVFAAKDQGSSGEGAILAGVIVVAILLINYFSAKAKVD